MSASARSASRCCSPARRRRASSLAAAPDLAVSSASWRCLSASWRASSCASPAARRCSSGPASRRPRSTDCRRSSARWLRWLAASGASRRRSLAACAHVLRGLAQRLRAGLAPLDRLVPRIAPAPACRLAAPPDLPDSPCSPCLPDWPCLAHLLRLLLHLLGKLFGLPPQLGLVAREPLETALHFLLVHLLAIARQVVLLTGQRFLPPRQRTHFFEQLVARVGLALFHALRRLVVGLLLPLQLAIEQRREILLVAVRPAAAAVGLLARDLAALDLGFGPQQMVQRLHLGWQRLVGLHRVERPLGARHRLRRRQQRRLLVLRAANDGARPPAPPAPSICACRPAVSARRRSADCARPSVLTSAADTPGVGAGRSALKLPGADDDVLLLADQVVDLLPAGARHGLALRHRELVHKRRHLEEEDVAARFGRPLAAAHVARPRVEAHEVARLDVEVLEIHRVPAGDRQPAAAAQRHGLLAAATHADDQLEPIEPVVVVGARFDGHLFERRDALVAGRTDDAHVGRTVVETADEVLGILGVFEAIGVAQAHAICGVVGDRRTRPRTRAVGGQRHFLSVPQHDGRRGDRRGRRLRRHAHRHARAFGRVDVAAVGLRCVAPCPRTPGRRRTGRCGRCVAARARSPGTRARRDRRPARDTRTSAARFRNRTRTCHRAAPSSAPSAWHPACAR